MRVTIDTRDPRLSPTQRLTLENLANHLNANPPPRRREPDAATVQAVDEALGKMRQ
jgi:hypothetical protein